LFSSFIAYSAEIEYIETLVEGDLLYLSENGTDWHEGVFLNYSHHPDCPKNITLDKDGSEFVMFDCPEDYGFKINVHYNSNNFEGVVNYISGRNPNRPPVSDDEIRGLLTRLDNILYAKDLGASSRSVASALEDRNRLIEVLEMLRSKLKSD
jgi:hypothetical protein